jgi:hypothetical protein
LILLSGPRRRTDQRESAGVKHSDAGNDEPIPAPYRPASEMHQGTKSRGMGHRQCSGRHEDCVFGRPHSAQKCRSMHSGCGLRVMLENVGLHADRRNLRSVLPRKQIAMSCWRVYFVSLAPWAAVISETPPVNGGQLQIVRTTSIAAPRFRSRRRPFLHTLRRADSERERRPPQSWDVVNGPRGASSRDATKSLQ